MRGRTTLLGLAALITAGCGGGLSSLQGTSSGPHSSAALQGSPTVVLKRALDSLQSRPLNESFLMNEMIHVSDAPAIEQYSIGRATQTISGTLRMRGGRDFTETTSDSRGDHVVVRAGHGEVQISRNGARFTSVPPVTANLIEKSLSGEYTRLADHVTGVHSVKSRQANVETLAAVVSSHDAVEGQSLLGPLLDELGLPASAFHFQGQSFTFMLSRTTGLPTRIIELGSVTINLDVLHRPGIVGTATVDVRADRVFH